MFRWNIVTQSLAVREHGFAKWVFDIRHDVVRSAQAYELFTEHMEQLRTGLIALRLNASTEPIIIEGADRGDGHTGDAGDNFNIEGPRLVNVAVAMLGNPSGDRLNNHAVERNYVVVVTSGSWAMINETALTFELQFHSKGLIALLGCTELRWRLPDDARDCRFFRWLDAKASDDISLQSEAHSGSVKMPDIYTYFEELISCVTQMKKDHQAAMTQMKEEHKKEICQLKEGDWKKDMQMADIKRRLDIYTVLMNKGKACLIEETSLKKEMLSTERCYMLDCDIEIFVWMGRNTPITERKTSNKDIGLSIFKHQGYNVKELPEEDFQPFIDSNGILKVRRVDCHDVSLIPAAEQSKLFSGDCFVVQCVYPGDGRDE
ncbi:actin filament capping [Asimina triloba]